VKICGLTRPEDARALGPVGAWAGGLILSRRGPRALDVERAREVRRAIPEGVLAVGVFVDEPAERVNRLARELGLDLVQLHGREPPELLDTLVVPALKMVPVDAGSSEKIDPASVRPFARAWGVLFDTRVAGASGGTGRTLPWELLDDRSLRAALPNGRLVLAGGIRAENVREALERVRPFAVDVASGVESAPGIKDREKLERLFSAAARKESAA
jgi:phosphoribosylanthranilate isomerase